MIIKFRWKCQPAIQSSEPGPVPDPELELEPGRQPKPHYEIGKKKIIQTH